MDSRREEAEKDIIVLKASRDARLEFNDKIVENSIDKSQGVTEILRTDMTHQLAEFYYLLSAFNIQKTEDFDSLIERHNTYLSRLIKDPQKMTRMGLTEQRVLDAIFDGETRPRVLKIWEDNPGAIDQSSLARLLVAVMSDETARKVLVACSKAGFLNRENSVFRLVLIRSNGTLERIYGDCIRKVRLLIQELNS